MDENTQQQIATIVTVVLLLCAYPIGLICMWAWPKWSKKAKVLITIVPTLAIIAISALTVGMLALINPQKKLENSQNVQEQKQLIGNIGTPVLRVDTFKLSAHEYGKPDAIIYQRVLSSLDTYEGSTKELTDVLYTLNQNTRKIGDTYYAILPDGFYIETQDGLEKVTLPSVSTEQYGWKDRKDMKTVAKDMIKPDKLLVTTKKEIIAYNIDAAYQYFVEPKTRIEHGDENGNLLSVISWKYNPTNKTFELQDLAEGYFSVDKQFNEDTSYRVDTDVLEHIHRSYGLQQINNLNNLTLDLDSKKIFNELAATYKVNDTYTLSDFVFLDSMTIKWLIHKAENKQITAIVQDLYFSNYAKNKLPEINIIDENTMRFKLYPMSAGKERYNKTEYTIEYSIKTGDVYLVN